MGLATSKIEHWLGILIDCKHGFALSLAAADSTSTQEERLAENLENVRMFVALAAGDASRVDSRLEAEDAQ
ncbi:MAG: hypothetical protein AAGG72_06190 [Pseudomonadota bacterium]